MNPRSPVPAVAPFVIQTTGPWLAVVPGAARWPVARRFSSNFWRGILARSRQLPRTSLSSEGARLTPFHVLTIGPPACEGAGARAADNAYRLDPANALKDKVSKCRGGANSPARVRRLGTRSATPT